MIMIVPFLAVSAAPIQPAVAGDRLVCHAGV